MLQGTKHLKPPCRRCERLTSVCGGVVIDNGEWKTTRR